MADLRRSSSAAAVTPRPPRDQTGPAGRGLATTTRAAPAPPTALPALAPAVPPISARLREMLGFVSTTASQVAAEDWFWRRLPARALIDEARRVVAECDALLVPAGPGPVLTWLRSINMTVRNPLPDGEFLIAAAAFTIALGRLPALCYTLDTQASAIALCDFWPSAAELHKLIAPDLLPYRARRAEVLPVARARPPTPLEARR